MKVNKENEDYDFHMTEMSVTDKLKYLLYCDSFLLLEVTWSILYIDYVLRRTSFISQTLHIENVHCLLKYAAST